MQSRCRASNFSEAETNLLLDLVEKHRDVVECTRTNRASLDLKDKIWSKITDEYNSEASPLPYRSEKVLRTKYYNLKKLMKTNVEATASPRSLDDESDVDRNSANSRSASAAYRDVSIDEMPPAKKSLWQIQPVAKAESIVEDPLFGPKYVKSSLNEEKLRKEIDIMEREHQIRIQIMREKHAVEMKEAKLRLHHMTERHELEMQKLRTGQMKLDLMNT